MLTTIQGLLGQEELELPKSYLGVSYGTSFPIRDFRDTDVSNPDAGFAKNGRKIDFYGGFFLGERTTLTGALRYQIFETEISDLIDTFNVNNPGFEFSGSTENWQVYYLLVGVAYRVKVGKRLKFFPRIGLGPLVANNPGITLTAPNASNTNNFARSSETGVGLGIELGIGLQTDLGRHFSLLPTFTFSRGHATIPEVNTTTDNVTLIDDYKPVIQSFNLGLSLAYKFYARPQKNEP